MHGRQKNIHQKISVEICPHINKRTSKSCIFYYTPKRKLFTLQVHLHIATNFKHSLAETKTLYLPLAVFRLSFFREETDINCKLSPIEYDKLLKCKYSTKYNVLEHKVRLSCFENSVLNKFIFILLKIKRQSFYIITDMDFNQNIYYIQYEQLNYSLSKLFLGALIHITTS